VTDERHRISTRVGSLAVRVRGDGPPVVPWLVDGCRVRHTLEISGPIAGLTRPFVAGLYQRKLDAEVAAVIRLAAEPVGTASAPPPDRQVSAPERAWHGIGRILRRGREEQRD
jgi:hypothetical protein